MIPFSPPKIYQEIIDEVVDTLKSGWITTGPKTKQLEKDLAKFCEVEKTICLNSATIGMELMLRWFGVEEGDEVIMPAYTYCSTANVVLHCGAIPVMVDSNENDFNIDVEAIKNKISSKTKVIVPVDIGGMPCDYDAINQLVKSEEVRKLFTPKNEKQKTLGRPLLMTDAAHSLGGKYYNKPIGTQADVSVFSFHAVKNLTTAEGGAIAFNLADHFDEEEIYREVNVKSLHGQNKDALAKTQKGSWKYDVVEAGYKANMTDILASLGLVELRRYRADTLVKREAIFAQYYDAFKHESWAILPESKTDEKVSSYHLFMLRIKDCTEEQRDLIIANIFEQDVSVNVHFQPLPLLTQYKNLGYKMDDYPNAYRHFKAEISLPVYYDLDEASVRTVCKAVKRAVSEVLN